MSRSIALIAIAAVALGLLGCGGAPVPEPEPAGPQGWYPHEGGLLKYRVQIRFGFEPENTMPKGWYFGRVSAVATDSAGEVYVFQRGAEADPIVVFDKDGKYLRSWGRDLDFGNEHGLRVDRDDNVWITDNGNHQVMKFNREGELLLTLGVRGESGEDDKHFFRPADITFGPDGSVYVADGYGNARVVKFSPEGEYITAWGKHGTGESEFNIVHSAAVDSKGTVYVSDRENNRIQIFDADGKFLRMWTHLGATQNIFITPDDEMWIITHRDNIENITYDTLAGRIMNIDMETGRIIGAMGKPRALDPRYARKIHLHRQPERECLPLVSGLDGRESGFGRGFEAGVLISAKVRRHENRGFVGPRETSYTWRIGLLRGGFGVMPSSGGKPLETLFSRWKIHEHERKHLSQTSQCSLGRRSGKRSGFRASDRSRYDARPDGRSRGRRRQVRRCGPVSLRPPHQHRHLR